jgi:hypothetical protein
MKKLTPKVPTNLDPIVAAVLAKLGSSPEAAYVIIGGGVALNCYIEPRATMDVDAWWSQHSSAQQREATVARIKNIVREIAADRPNMHLVEDTRAASEMRGIELEQNGKTIFSFQVAPRSLELEAPVVTESPFAPIPIETLTENVGAKMSALVSRGAPRDFNDIVRVSKVAEILPSELWNIYQRKNPTADVTLAKAQVAQKLAAIELRRPLEKMQSEERVTTAAVRDWLKKELIGQPFA